MKIILGKVNYFYCEDNPKSDNGFFKYFVQLKDNNIIKIFETHKNHVM